MGHRAYSSPAVRRTRCYSMTCSLIGAYCHGWTTATLCFMVLHAVSSIQKLQRVQNIAARIATVAKKCSSTDRLQAGHTDNQDPSFINPSVPRPSHQIASNSTNPRRLVFVPPTRLYCTNLLPELSADRPFCCTAPTVWNSLSNDVV